MNNTTPTAPFKSQLAKLLATENITFRHDAGASTAFFDVKNRELVLPVWQNISEDLYDMLVVHEVGHALDTPYEGWKNAVDDIAKRLHGDRWQAAVGAVKGFLNVIEDARIDKRQKRRYPGSKRNYIFGYKELITRDFFGTSKRNIHEMSFIDRANIYFKGGFALGIKFSAEERAFIRRMEEQETFSEAVALTEDIYAWSREKGQQNQILKSNDFGEGEYSEDDDSEWLESDDDFDSSDDDVRDGDLDRDGKGRDDEGETSDQDTQGTGKRGERGQGDINENSDSGAPKSSDRGAGSSSSSTDDYIPEAETERAWQKNISSIVADSQVNYIYLDVPKADTTKIVDDYKLYLNGLRTYNDLSWVDGMTKKAADFKREENKNISFLIKEFEQRKAADAYAKISIAKTGVIDTNKLHSYKYNDDIFRRSLNVPTGKNHGFVMFLDWSGSMSPYVESTVKQLVTLTQFCKRVGIPFEVYTFRDLVVDGYPNPIEPNFNPFPNKQGLKNYMNISDYGFKLRNVLSSRMNVAELNKAYSYLFMGGSNRNEPMGGTPLNAAIVAAEEVVNDFRRKTKVEIVNVIFLTDGDSNPVSGFVYDKTQYPWRRGGNKYIIRDRVTKKEYNLGSDRYQYQEVTSALLKILKDRTNCNLIGFFLTNDSISYLTRKFSVSEESYDKLSKQWKNDGFVSISSSGYDQYFLINQKTMKIDKNDLEVNADMSTKKIAQQFIKFSEKKTVNRVLLRQFIDLVAVKPKMILI